MIYKKFQEKQLSNLGFGTMRLPVVDGNDSEIDIEETQKLVDIAMDAGVNYYDTAWGYHEGNSETVIAKCLSKYPRNNYYLADKFPGYDNSNMPKVKEIFNKQLKKCRTDYFDFYLIHNVYEGNIDDYLNPKFKIMDYLVKMKNEGKIKHIGVSFHGSLDVMKRFLDAYGKNLEFAQLQLNYLDWNFQDAKSKYELITSYNLPVWVMEPLRGGKLVKIGNEHLDTVKNISNTQDAVSIAFRFLQSLPNVKVILSGMSSKEQVEQNIMIFKDDAPLNKEQFDSLIKFANNEVSKIGLPCTACNYCAKYCPKHLPISKHISLYNEHKITGGGFIAPMAVKSMAKEMHPSNCIACKKCEQVCPQQIEISKMMKEFTEMVK